jgi:hypothetical protein
MSSSLLCYILRAAESLLARTLAMRLSHADLAAAWTASPEVRKATEQLLGVPNWRMLSEPLLRACLVRLCTFNEFNRSITGLFGLFVVDESQEIADWYPKRAALLYASAVCCLLIQKLS